MSPNSTPREPLCGHESDERGEKVVRDADAEKTAQTGVQGVDPREGIRDTIATTLNRSGYWLPTEGQRAIADALTAHQPKEQP